MLANPFTPSSIATRDHDFFGRERELRALTRGLDRGSVLIQGPIGIGKSSLLARALFLMQDLHDRSEVGVVSAVADREIDSADVLSRLLLEELVEVDERSRKVSLRLGPVHFESGAVYRNFREGRHLAALKGLLHSDLMGAALGDRRLLVIAIDEADKCPTAMARLVRSVTTQLQAKGHENVRFLLAGVSPFLQNMVEEDSGVERFFDAKINLAPLTRPEAGRLLREKVRYLESYAAGEGFKLTIVANVLQRILDMAGGHPHLLQLLGSHLVESENDRPDGVLDEEDLVGALRRICYDERGAVYDNTIHFLDMSGHLSTLRRLLAIGDPGFPTRIEREAAVQVAPLEKLQWLVEHNILLARSQQYYGLVDEFLRVRLSEWQGTRSEADR